jgi:hypothetical protein
MSTRIILGKKDSEEGLWVSAPGKNATSTVFNDLLVDTTRINTQPLIKGLVSSLTLYFNGSLSVEPTIWHVNTSVTPTTYYWNSGVATYIYDIVHNLGFVPLCHISILSSYAGTPSPHMFIDDEKIRLKFDETWYGFNAVGGYSEYNVPDSKPSSLSFNYDLHYALFRQEV